MSVCEGSIWMARFWMSIRFCIRMRLRVSFARAWRITGVLRLYQAQPRARTISTP